jgi:hypothetical protein
LAGSRNHGNRHNVGDDDSHEAVVEEASGSSTAAQIVAARWSSADFPTLSPELSVSLDEITTIVIRSFAPEEDFPLLRISEHESASLICGSWVEVLPMLAGRSRPDSPLVPSLRALATSALTRGPNRRATTAQGIAAYGAALQPVKATYGRGTAAFEPDLAVSIMLLLLTEVWPGNPQNHSYTTLTG